MSNHFVKPGFWSKHSVLMTLKASTQQLWKNKKLTRLRQGKKKKELRYYKAGQILAAIRATPCWSRYAPKCEGWVCCRSSYLVPHCQFNLQTIQHKGAFWAPCKYSHSNADQQALRRWGTPATEISLNCSNMSNSPSKPLIRSVLSCNT